jgi:hypothetical protein
VRLGTLAIALSMALLGASPASATERLASVSPLIQRLQRAGRGEAVITQTVVSAAETLRSERGTLVLEPPDRLRIDFRSGERVTMRGDGGEWIQPSLRQLLILRPEQAQTVLVTWRAFLDGGAGAYRERARGARRYRLVPLASDEAGADSLDVQLGPDGLPRRLELWVGDQRWWLTLSRWTFAKPKGVAAFTLRAPPGYSVFQWP